MPSTYSPKLRFELVGAGEQAGLWGATTNKNVGQLIEQAIAGVTTVELDGLSGNYTLTALDGTPDQARSAVIECTYTSVPASGPINLIIPTQTKLYVVRNDSGQQLTVKTSGQVATPPVLDDGEATLVFCNGSDAILGLETAAAGTLDVYGGGTGRSTFTAGVVYSPGGTGALDTYTSLPVSLGGTGQTAFTAGSLLIGNGTGGVAMLSGGTSGYIATWNGSTWVASAPPSSGVTSVGGTGSVSGITLSGTVTTSGYLTLGGSLSLTSGQVTSALGYTPANASSTPSLSSNNTWTGLNVFNQYLTSQYYNFTATSSIYYYSPSGQVNIDVSSATVAGFKSSQTFLGGTTTDTKTIQPQGDNAYSCGTSGQRWSVVYAATGTINTSDANTKTEITDLDAAEKRVATRIKGLIKKFKFKDAVAEKGANARIHVGVIAQEVAAAFTAEGLDANKYGLFCEDSWDSKPASLNERGEVLTPAIEGGTRLGVRYEELLAFVIAAL
jgi:hypothetical protein